jgi:hypothetical protein
MGNSRSSLQLQPEEIEEITEETGFTKQQIERLYARFSSLDKQSHGYLTREDFLRIPELAINPLGDRIVHAFFYESKNTDEEKVDFKVSSRIDMVYMLQSLLSISGLCACCCPLPACQEEPCEEQAEHPDGETPLRIQNVRPGW